MREKYAVGFRNGLVVTAKSDSRLFHAGSRLGKKLNQELEELYFAADSISDEIRLLRTGVLSNISDWRAPFVTFAQSHKIFSASSITLLVLVILSIGLHHIFVLPLEIRDQALRVLLWNPDPLNIGGDLVISCGAALIAGLFIWPFAGSHALRSDDLSTYRRWEALEEKWSQAMEYEEFIVEDDDSRIHYQNTQSQAQDPNLQWFQILNVHEHAPPDDIKQAYRDAIRQYHPDKVSGLGEKLRKVAEEESQKINAAFSEAKRRRGFV